MLSQANFELQELPKPTELAEGTVLVRNLYASLDPTHRLWADEAPTSMMPVKIGAPMRATTVGLVEQSNAPDLPVGSYVTCVGNVQTYHVASVKEDSGLYPIPSDAELPLTARLSILSRSIGLSAWVGVYDICNVHKGDTLVISAAAGAIGSLAGQLAKMRGARVIGIVGSEAKKRWVLHELMFDGAVLHTGDEQELLKQLRELAPRGVDAYFDNTGGAASEAVLQLLNVHGRVALCGMISGYTSGEMGVRRMDMVLHRRATVRGFLWIDHLPRWAQVSKDLTTLLKVGQLRHREDVQEGIDNYAAALNRLFDGSNTGKLILKL
jgi:NADPH-dependent curcumin reductase CurA